MFSKMTKLTVLIQLFSLSVFAAGPSLSNLTQTDFDNVIKELSANSSFHSVTGAASLGSVFGLELALVGGTTATPNLNSISKSIDPSASASVLPHASLLAAVSVPFGITIEALIFPSTSVGDVTYQQTGAAVKWTMNSALVLPINIALRGFMTKNELSFKQTLNNASTGNTAVDVTVKQTNSQTGLQLLLSPNLPILEPYLGLGMVSANGKLEVAGATTGTIFGFTSSQSAESSPSTTQYLVGVNAHLLLFSLGAEYSKAFGTDSYNAKLGFKF